MTSLTLLARDVEDGHFGCFFDQAGDGRVDWPLCTPRVPHFPLPASAVQCAKKERTRSLDGFWQEFLGRATFKEAGGFLNARAIGVAWVICLTACI